MRLNSLPPCRPWRCSAHSFCPLRIYGRIRSLSVIPYVYGIPVACYHERSESLFIGTVLKSKKLCTIIHGHIYALVEAAQASLRADLWPHLARLETAHDNLWTAFA